MTLKSLEFAGCRRAYYESVQSKVFMLVTATTETDAEFRIRVSKMLERFRASKAPEILSIDGEAQSVLVSPSAFDEMQRLIEDQKFYTSMGVAFQGYKDGKGQDVDVVFDRLEAKLLKMQADQLAGADK